MRNKIIQFIKDFVLMAIIIIVVEFIFYKLNIVNECSFSYIVGFMLGWALWQLIVLYINNKKNK